MEDISLKSGVCPKCGYREVYTDKELPKRGERMQLVISSWKWFSMDTYLCTHCGHFEEYIRKDELKNEKVVDKVKELWNKVEG